jgi:hypothetical protein
MKVYIYLINCTEFENCFTYKVMDFSGLYKELYAWCYIIKTTWSGNREIHEEVHRHTEIFDKAGGQYLMCLDNTH